MVVQFEEKFQADSAGGINLETEYGNGWVMDDTGAEGLLLNNNITSILPFGAALGFQQTTIPLTSDQYVRAWVSSAENSASGLDASLAVGMFAFSPRLGGSRMGFGVRLTYESDSSRTLQLIQGTSDGPSGWGAIGASATVTTSMRTVSASDLSVPQEIAIASTVVPGGILLRGYLNEGDVSAPDVEFLVTTDYPPGYNIPADDKGDWWFLIGSGSAADQLRIHEFSATDEFDALSGTEGTQVRDQLTLSEIRTRVKNRYENASNTNISDDLVDEFINDAVQEIWQEMVDIATFMEPESTIAISRDSDGFFTMPPYVDSVLSIWRTDQRREASWGEWTRTTDDRVVIKFNRVMEPTGFDAKVRYRLRQERMNADTDRCSIPREYSSVIDYSVLMRLAEGDSVGNRFEIYSAGYMRTLTVMKRKENHKRNLRRRAYRVMRQSGRVPGQLVPFSTTGI